ncbi:MAG: tetratricopeptide repeat protein [Armatimonadota bacterium]|nr:tetratricopeptide repeat protein [Armatimonadota bacterium]
MRHSIIFAFSLGLVLLAGAIGPVCTAAPAPVEARTIQVPAPISPAAINAPLVVARIKAGEMTVEEAWQKGLLKEDDLLFLLGQEGGDRGSLNLVDTSGLGSALVELLIKHYPERVAKPESLSAGVRFRLADYYFKRNRKDPQAGRLLEGILKEIRTTVKAESATRAILPWYYEPASTLLGEHYQDTGQYQKALDTFLGALKNSKHPGYAGDWMLAAARTAMQMGDEKKAQQFYAQVKQYGSAWAAGTAVGDQAELLMDEKKFAEARRLLQPALATAGTNSIRIVLLKKLGYLYYVAGEFDTARKHFEEALAHFNSLNNPRPGNGLDITISVVKGYLRYIDQWTKQPIVCRPDEVRLVMDDPHKPVKTTLIVQTFHLVPLTVIADNPNVQVSIIDRGSKDPSVSGGTHVERQIIVEIAPLAAHENLDAAIIVSSQEILHFKLRVPLHIQLKTENKKT